MRTSGRPGTSSDVLTVRRVQVLGRLVFRMHGYIIAASLLERFYGSSLCEED